MADFTINLHGIPATERALSDSGRSLVAEMFPDALEAAIAVVAGELAVRTPVGRKPSKGKRLKDAIATDVVIHKDQLGGTAHAGFGDLGYRAEWVEFGHAQVGHRPGKDPIGTTPAHPFMRTASDVSAAPAIEAFGDSLEDQLRKVKS